MAAKFELGIERKRQEKQRFLLLAFEDPRMGQDYQKLCDFLDYEVRYYEIAAAYYRNDFDNLTGDDYDALLYLTKLSEPAPRLYAQYIRHIDPSAREDEKLTHTCLRELKESISKVMQSGAV